MKEEPYKIDLIEHLPEDAVISFYRQGEFTDLCAGPHIASTGGIKVFKLLSLAGAYWRGDEKNKMLQRIYAIAFTKQDELKAYLDFIEDAKRRDHRKLGKELDLFDIYEEGPGFPFFLPKGMVIRNILEDFLAQRASQKWLSGNQNSHDPQPGALASLWALGSLQRQHVYNYHRQ